MSKTEEKEAKTKAGIKDLVRNSIRLTKDVWHEKKRMYLVMWGLYAFVAFMPFINSGSQGILINELVGLTEGHPIGFKFFLVVAIFVLAIVIPPFVYNLERYFGKLFYFYLEEKYQMDVLKKKGELDVALHEDAKYQDLMNKVNESGVWRVQNFTDRQFFIVQGLIEVIIASAILIIAKWWLFLIVLAGTLPELINESRYGKQVWSIHSAKASVKRRFWDLENHFQRITKITELRLFQNTSHILSAIKNLFNEFRTEERKNETHRFKAKMLVLLMSQAVMVFAVGFFIWEVLKGHILIGTFIFLLASVSQFRGSLSGLFQSLATQYQDSLFVSDIFRLLDLKNILSQASHPVKLDGKEPPEIAFHNVSFKYPGSNELVLKNFDLTIKPGEKLALVGINGSGKTTFVKLLCRFYDPTEGSITVNGIDLKEIDLESWYAQLGVLFQEYANYNFMVRDSIKMGQMSAPTKLENVMDAAVKSGSNEFIENWEGKYSQQLGKQFEGIEPSIGQWQKLALARVFFRNPNILVLDEPTSSIDAEAEAKIFDRIEEISKNKSIILISHRFSTVRKADKICVIEKGRIKELGSHKILLDLDGTYARLFKLQAKGYK